jgi:ribosomal protein S1
MAKATITMDDLLNEEAITQLTPGEVVDGKILSVRKHELWVDLGAHGVGLATS